MDTTKKRPKRPPTDEKLVLSNGRLTPEYWLLLQGMTQPVRPQFNQWSRTYCYKESTRLHWLVEQGYMVSRDSARGKSASEYLTTPEGAFAVLVAKGQHDAWYNKPKEKAPKRRRPRSANAKVQAPDHPEQEACPLEALLS